MNLIPRNFYLNDIFDDFMPVKDFGNMKCDIYEKDGNYNIEMDVPGFSKQDISIEANNGYLTITAEKKEDGIDEEKNYVRRERMYGKYQRSFYFGDLNEDEIKAEFKNGTLSIMVPKKEKLETKKSIEIE